MKLRQGRRRLALAVLLAVGALPAGAAPARAAARPSFPVVALAPTTTGDGYWLAAADGGVFSSGDAAFRGSVGGRRLNAPVVGMAADPDGDGYWLVASDGGIFSFGAPFLGSLGGRALNAPIVGMTADPNGAGYLLVARDGGVFAFGSAAFRGSTGGRVLNRPIVGMAADPDGDGYWLVASDGGTFSFGAAFAGSLGGRSLVSPVSAMVSDPDGDGYWLVAGDGGVFSFSAPFLGSRGGSGVGGPVVGAGAVPAGGGYWLAGGDGSVYAYGEAEALSGFGDPVLSVSAVATGLDNPWDVGLTPDATMLYTERAGRLWARSAGAATSRLLGAPGDVFASGEGGMLGLAVDPDFARNGRVYVCQSWTDGRTRDVRAYAWALDPAATSATRSERPLVAGLPAGSGRHNGCRPRVGPDGALWVGTGDAATGTVPQDLGSLGGKVVRVDRFTGAPAPGNPFASPVYTYGHRNVQGLAFRPGTGQAYSAEHGPDRDDEVNILRPGGNGGWNPSPNGSQSGRAEPGYDESVPMTDLRRYPSAMRPVWTSGSPTLAPSGAAFLEGRQWRSWDGALAVAMLRGNQLRMLELDAGGGVTRQTTVLTGYGRLRSPVLGPDGSLYVTTDNGGGDDRILRVTAG